MTSSENRFDDNGWALTPPALIPLSDAYSLLSPEESSRLEEGQLQRQARRFFRAELALAAPKRYPGNGYPLADEAVIEVGELGAAPSTRVRLITVPLGRVPSVLEAARAAVVAMGDGGFGALLDRAARLWQVAVTPLAGTDQRAPLVLTGVLSSWLLAPVLPPDGKMMFGVKGAQQRLAAAGWKT